MEEQSSWYWYTFIVAVVTLLYLSIKWELNYFKRRNIKYFPYFPLVGNLYGMVLHKEHLNDLIQRLYSTFPNEKYVGYMQMNKPIIMIRDLDLIKQITIKDFDHFMNHDGIFSEEIDPLFGNNIFVLKGQKWRDMRSTLSPAFTGSKMRYMFEFITETGELMANYYVKQTEEPEFKERGLLEVEIKDAFTRYAGDIIATTAFGLKIDSLTNKDNEFYKMARRATKFSGLRGLKFFAYSAFPRLMKLFKIRLFDKEEHDFLYNVVKSTMISREKEGIVRNDMIQLLIEAKNGVLRHETTIEEKDTGFAIVQESDVGKQNVKREWTDYEIVAQAVIFLMAGFESSSTLLCVICHALTVYPEIQKKLQHEIDEVLLKNNNRLNYNALVNMKYIDMVVTETLRMWSPAPLVDRICTATYKLPPCNDFHEGYTIQKGEVIGIPIYGFHHDPQYYPNPEVFDPERFSDENKANINPTSFMPFGIGPRNCIGSRFALLETKAALFHLLAKFDFVQTAKTMNPIEFQYMSPNLNPKDGFWIGMKPRTFPGKP